MKILYKFDSDKNDSNTCCRNNNIISIPLHLVITFVGELIGAKSLSSLQELAVDNR